MLDEGTFPGLSEASFELYFLNPRISNQKEYVDFDSDGLKGKPCLIMCLNSSQIKKIINEQRNQDTSLMGKNRDADIDGPYYDHTRQH